MTLTDAVIIKISEDLGISLIGENCHSLKIFNVCYCYQATGINIIKVVEGNLCLKELKLSDCGFIGDACVSKIGKYYPNLKYLSLSGNGRNICAFGLFKTSCRLPSFTHLILRLVWWYHRHQPHSYRI